MTTSTTTHRPTCDRPGCDAEVTVQAQAHGAACANGHRRIEVIQDSYGNPAILHRSGSAPRTITQLVGSDRGRTTYLPARLLPVTPEQRAWALRTWAALHDPDRRSASAVSAER